MINGLALIRRWREAGRPIVHVRRDSGDRGILTCTRQRRQPVPAGLRAPGRRADGQQKRQQRDSSDTDLDLRLRRVGARHVIAFGISTDMCVSTTVRTGAKWAGTWSWRRMPATASNWPDDNGGTISAKRSTANGGNARLRVLPRRHNRGMDKGLNGARWRTPARDRSPFPRRAPLSTPALDQPVGGLRAEQQMVDAKARVARPGAGLIIPEGVEPAGRMARADRIGPALLQAVERRPGSPAASARHRPSPGGRTCRGPRDDIVVAGQHRRPLLRQDRRRALASRSIQRSL